MNFNYLANKACIMCGEKCDKVTCSKFCHEEFVKECIDKYGLFKKITDWTTKISYKVPTRVIIEKGIRQEELSNFPVWE